MLEICCLSSGFYFSVNKKGFIGGWDLTGRIVKCTFAAAARKNLNNKGPAGLWCPLCWQDFTEARWQSALTAETTTSVRWWEGTAGNVIYIPDCQQIMKLTFKNKADNSQSNAPSVSPLMHLISLTLNWPCPYFVCCSLWGSSWLVRMMMMLGCWWQSSFLSCFFFSYISSPTSDIKYISYMSTSSVYFSDVMIRVLRSESSLLMIQTWAVPKPFWMLWFFYIWCQIRAC